MWPIVNLLEIEKESCITAYILQLNNASNTNATRRDIDLTYCIKIYLKSYFWYRFKQTDHLMIEFCQRPWDLQLMSQRCVTAS